METPEERQNDPAWQAVDEGGGGEQEGFEQAEEALIEHASHGDQESAHDVIHRAGQPEEAEQEKEFGEPDRIIEADE
jgi:hypothetical protein